MSASTAVLASFVVAYFLHLTIRARKDILRFGPAMVAGVAVGLGDRGVQRARPRL